MDLQKLRCRRVSDDGSFLQLAHIIVVVEVCKSAMSEDVSKEDGLFLTPDLLKNPPKIADHFLLSTRLAWTRPCIHH
jgi:hypothetical protein